VVKVGALNVPLCFQIMMDNKLVRFLSTMHKPANPGSGEGSMKPRWNKVTREYMEVYIPPVKVSYDFGKVGCDLFDQFMALIATEFKTYHIWTAHLIWLWQGTLVNAHLHHNRTAAPGEAFTLVEDTLLLLGKLLEKANALEASSVPDAKSLSKSQRVNTANSNPNPNPNSLTPTPTPTPTLTPTLTLTLTPTPTPIPTPTLTLTLTLTLALALTLTLTLTRWTGSPRMMEITTLHANSRWSPTVAYGAKQTAIALDARPVDPCTLESAGRNGIPSAPTQSATRRLGGQWCGARLTWSKRHPRLSASALREARGSQLRRTQRKRGKRTLMKKSFVKRQSQMRWIWEVLRS